MLDTDKHSSLPRVNEEKKFDDTLPGGFQLLKSGIEVVLFLMLLVRLRLKK
jgi:hypothetical protein